MAYRLTPHVAARIAERNIPAAWLDQALVRPRQVVDLGSGRHELRHLFHRDGKLMVLRVVCEGERSSLRC